MLYSRAVAIDKKQKRWKNKLFEGKKRKNRYQNETMSNDIYTTPFKTEVNQKSLKIMIAR